MTGLVGHIGSLRLLAAGDEGGAIAQLIVVVIIMIASAIGGMINKRRQQQEQQRPQEDRTSPAPTETPGQWPPMGTTTGTTVPTARRPQGQPTPPVARPRLPDQDRRKEELEQLERDRQQRARRIEQEMLERAERLKTEAQARAEEARAKVEAARRIRQAAQRTAQAAERSAVAPSIRAALPLPAEAPVERIVPDDLAGRTRPMPDRLKALMREPNWRTAILLAEILSPPVGMREPNSSTGTLPPGMSG